MLIHGLLTPATLLADIAGLSEQYPRLSVEIVKLAEKRHQSLTR